MNQVATIETPRPALPSGGKVRAIVPQSMDEAYRLAKAVCIAAMAPKGLDTPEKAMIAIMHGMEVGLTPMAALQRIAVVNGRPTIWGDGAMGLVRGSGLCEYVRETVAGDGDRMTATCEAKRRGEAEPITRTFSVADAKAAGLWGKAGPWQQYPKRMLQMRARAFALRDGFADVLGGLYLREEIEDDRSARDVTPPPAGLTPPPAPKALTPPAVAASDAQPPVHDPETEEVDEDAPALLPPADSAGLLKALLRAMGQRNTTATLHEWRDERQPSIATLQPEDRATINNEVEARLAELYEAESRAAEDG